MRHMESTLHECKDCDFENPVKKGRAYWCCPKCDRDYSLEYVFYRQAIEEVKEGGSPLPEYPREVNVIKASDSVGYRDVPAHNISCTDGEHYHGKTDL